MFIVPLTSMPSLEEINKVDTLAEEKKESEGNFGDILKQKIQNDKRFVFQRRFCRGSSACF